MKTRIRQRVENITATYDPNRGRPDSNLSRISRQAVVPAGNKYLGYW
jgi:hypothetical protein